MMDHHHHAHHHQIPVSIPPVSVHDISRLQQHQIFHNPANIVHEAGTGNNNIHSNNSNNVHVSQNGNGDDGKPLVEMSKKGESGEKIVRYRECQKNHAANIGSHALDGCGEFMASGLEGTAEALKCQACGCHRNFHRQEVEGEGGLDGWYSGPAGRSRVDKKRLLPGGANSSEPVTLRAFINKKQKAPTAIRFCFSSAHIAYSFRRLSNMKKMVLKVSIEDEKSKRRAMKAVAAVEGVESVAVDIEKREISVIGEADPVVLAKKLMKLGFTELLSVGSAKEEKAAAETPTVVYHPQLNPHYAYGAYEVNPHYAYGPYEGYSSYTVVRGEDPNGCTIC